MGLNDLHNKSISNNIEVIIFKIENLRKELDSKVILGINSNEILELSRKLDKLIVDYLKIKLN